MKGKRPKTTFIYRKTIHDLSNPTKRVPTLGNMIPKDPVSIEAADKAWAETRTELAKFLEEAENPANPFIKFNFLFGLGSASDLLTLLEAHSTYHEKRFPA